MVDLEIKLDMRGVSDDSERIAQISKLMQLYSSAIEHYNKTADEENQNYYVDKLSRLNDQIRVLVDRQNRQMQRKNKAEAKAPITKGKVDKMVNPLSG